jgi:uncharacterized membrane protein
MESLAELHPLLVHFPIAFFILYILFEFTGLFTKEKKLAYFIHSILSLAVVTSILALLTGNSAEKEVMALIEQGAAVPKDLVIEHRDFANITIWYFLALLIIRTYFIVKSKLNLQIKLVMLILGIIGGIFVYYTGLYGAELVYKYGAGTELIK